MAEDRQRRGACGLPCGALPGPGARVLPAAELSPPWDPSSSSGSLGFSSGSKWWRAGPASVGAPAVAVVGGLVGLGFLGDGAALAALPGATLQKGQKEKRAVSAGEPPPAYSTGQCWCASAPEDGPGQALWATAPWQLPICLSPAELPGTGAAAASSTVQLHCPCPSTLPQLHAILQGHGQLVPSSREGGDGEGLVRVVSARGCVCVHTLTEGLSPRLAGPWGTRKGLRDPGEP